MQEMIKNLFYLGAGAAFVTKEKIEELKNELVEKGKMTQDEGKKFVDELMKKSEDMKKEIDDKINRTVTERLEKMNVATGDDLADLRQQIQELRALVEKPKKS
ncbi:MAG: hypothetical protein M8357_13600 [Desulfobulbaceae bacterium]|nr:hypothetical protein [Desulfobulbaceae bacterium]